MLILRKRILSGHRYDVRQERRFNPLVLFKQVQEELVKIRKRCPQAEMDEVLRKRRKRQSLKLIQSEFRWIKLPYQIPYESLSSHSIGFRYIPNEERTVLLRFAISNVEEQIMFGSKKNKQPKLNLMALSDIEKYRLIKRVKEDLRQKAVEAKLWNLFLETESLTLNGKQICCEENGASRIYLKTGLLTQ
jgi:hypothetical protein